MTADPWYHHDPGRLQREEDALTAAGLAFRRVDEMFADGVAQYEVAVPGSDSGVNVVATFPDAYPYFMPQVMGPDLSFGHHWDPRSAALCLMRDDDWDPEDGRLATLLTEQWAKLLQTERGDGRDIDGTLLEVDQAELVTAHITTVPGSHLVLKDVDVPDGSNQGKVVIAVTNFEPLRGYVGEVRDHAGSLLGRVDPLFIGKQNAIAAQWVRLTELPARCSPQELFAAVVRSHPAMEHAGWVNEPGRVGKFAPQIQVILVALPEEVRRRELGVGWIALERRRDSSRRPPRSPRAITIAQASSDNVIARAPELTAIADKKVVVVGAGAIGSTLVLELGRMLPREVVIVDADLVDAATAVRWHGAFRFAGVPKVQALQQMLCETQPYTETNGSYAGRIGAVRARHGLPDQHQALRDALREASLLVDATASVRAQYYLSEMARMFAIPYLQVEATVGAWGGLVALLSPKCPFCWMCLQHHLDVSIEPLPRKRDGSVQPAGCAHPTYTAAGFDLSVIASHAARVAAAVLSDGAYGEFDSNVMTVALRSDDGEPILPKWRGYCLERHPECRNHIL